MKKNIKTLFLILIVSISCKEKTNTKTSSDFTPSTHQSNDSIYVEEEKNFEEREQDSIIFDNSKKIYYISYNDNGDAFIDISESMIWDSDDTSSKIIPKENMGENPYHLNDVQKELLLKKNQISSNDSLFVFDLEKDTICKFKINNFPAIAYINVYSEGNEQIEEYDYEFGFNLGKEFPFIENNYASISDKNPFQIGKVKKVIWKESNKKLAFFDTIQSFQHIIGNVNYKKLYQFTTKDLKYYLQEIKKIEDNGQEKYEYQLAILNPSGKLISTKIFKDKGFESGELYSLEDISHSQYVGAYFKGKSSVLPEFIFSPFGCPHISFIDEKDLPILILCDNRH